MSKIRMQRRDFLKLGAITAGAAMISGCEITDKAESSAAQVRALLDPDGGMMEILRYASLAASGHNTQPWKFGLDGNTIEIHPDLTRSLPVVDPQERELWISLGCALENLVIAAAASGFTAQIDYPEEGRQFIKIALQPSAPQQSPLFDAIPFRQSTRTEYKVASLLQDNRDMIYAAASEPGVVVQYLDDQASLEQVLEYVNQGNLTQYSDAAFMAELIEWIRFNKNDALATLDGLYSKCSGSPTVPRWIGRMVVSGTLPQNQADADAIKMRSSQGAILLASEKEDLASWVHVGQVFERLSLTLTSLGMKSSLLNQPIEVPELRDQFREAMGLGSSQPQLLLRYGYADAMPYSLRRPVQDLLM